MTMTAAARRLGCVIACVASTLVVAARVESRAADACHTCRGTAGGMTTPAGDTGCGPRYCGEKHEPSRPDPCDACGRWRGCNGARQNPEMLAPWQLPPGRGFRSPAEFGYRTAPCSTCGPAGLLH